MSPEAKGLSLPENLEDQQRQMLGALVQAGKWSEIVPEMFPLIPKPLVELAKESAFDARMDYMDAQIARLEQIIRRFDDNVKVQELANGRIKELSNEQSAILVARFPKTLPHAVSKKEAATALLDRDANSTIQFFVGLGEIEAITPETIPALKYLKPETIVELKIDALLAKLARYKNWKSLEVKGEKLGFPITKDGQKSNLDKLADKLTEITAQQIESLAQERLDLENTK